MNAIDCLELEARLYEQWRAGQRASVVQLIAAQPGPQAAMLAVWLYDDLLVHGMAEGADMRGELLMLRSLLAVQVPRDEAPQKDIA